MFICLRKLLGNKLECYIFIAFQLFLNFLNAQEKHRNIVFDIQKKTKLTVTKNDKNNTCNR